MKIVGGYFDSEADATLALDQLMRVPGYEKIETRVLSSYSGEGGDSGVVPVGAIPHTSGGPSNITGPMAGAAVWRRDDMFGALPKDEQRYFNDALSKGQGGVLVLAQVKDEQAMEVRTLFSRAGGRTIEEKK